MNDDPHPDMRGCLRYSPGPAAPAGVTFNCPECGRVYVREKPRGGLAMWRALREFEPRHRRRTVVN